MKKTAGWLPVIGLAALCAFASRCTSVRIGDETVKVLRNDMPFFGNRRYESPETRFRRDRYWSGVTRRAAVIRAAGGGIAVPKGSSIDRTKGVTEPEVYVIRGELEPLDRPALFGNVIDRPLRSVSVTGNGEIAGFSAPGGLRMELDGIAFLARGMTRGMIPDTAPAGRAGPWKEYIRFDCESMDPLQIDGSSRIAFAGGGTGRFTLTAEEDGYGFHRYTLQSPGEARLVLEHPSLEGETGVHAVRFDLLYRKVLGYTAAPGGEETLIPYQEGSLRAEGNTDEALFAELLREALWRNFNKNAK